MPESRSYLQRSVVLTADPQRVVPSRADRCYLLLQNRSASPVYFVIGDDGADATAARGFVLQAGDSFSLEQMQPCGPAPSAALWAAGAGVLVILEG